MIHTNSTKEMIDHIESDIGLLPDELFNHDDRAVFSFKTDKSITRFSCKNSQDHARDLVKRMRKNMNPKGLFKLPGKVRGSSPSVIISNFIKDGEIENAVQFSEMVGKPIYIAANGVGNVRMIKKAQLIEPGFVLGEVGPDITVTHLASGRAVGRGGQKLKTLSEFEKLKQHGNFQKVCDDADCNFQSRIMELR